MKYTLVTALSTNGGYSIIDAARACQGLSPYGVIAEIRTDELYDKMSSVLINSTCEAAVYLIAPTTWY
jgi:hypothetical protein